MEDKENIINIIEKEFKEYEHSSEKCLTYELETMSIKEALELASVLHVAAFDCLACDIESAAGYLEDLLATGKRALEAGDHETFYIQEYGFQVGLKQSGDQNKKESKDS